MEIVKQSQSKAPDTEKITINLGYVDLGHIDLLVAQGFYSNRTTSSGRQSGACSTATIQRSSRPSQDSSWTLVCGTTADMTSSGCAHLVRC